MFCWLVFKQFYTFSETKPLLKSRVCLWSKIYRSVDREHMYLI